MGDSDSDNSHNGLPHTTLGLAVGLGVGVPVLLTIVILVWLTARHRRIAREEDERYKDIDIDADYAAAMSPMMQRQRQVYRYAPQGSTTQQARAMLRQERQEMHTRSNSEAASAASLHFPQPHEAGGSAYAYTPYMTGERGSIDEWSRSLHSLVGPSPAFPSPQRLRNVRSASSLSSQWGAGSQSSIHGGVPGGAGGAGGAAPGLPHSNSSTRMGSSLRQEMSLTDDEEFNPHHLRKNSLPGSRRNSMSSLTRNAAAPAAPITFGAELPSDDAVGRPSPQKRRSVINDVHDEHDERGLADASGSVSGPTENRLSNVDEVAEAAEMPVVVPVSEPVAGSMNDNSVDDSIGATPNTTSASDTADVSRANSRGHAAVLDLYDTYRQKSVRQPGAPLEESEENEAEHTDDNVADLTTDSIAASTHLDRPVNFEGAARAELYHEPPHAHRGYDDSDAEARSTDYSPHSNTFSGSPADSPELSQATEYSRGNDSAEDDSAFSFDELRKPGVKALPALPQPPAPPAPRRSSPSPAYPITPDPAAASTDTFVSAREVPAREKPTSAAPMTAVADSRTRAYDNHAPNYEQGYAPRHGSNGYAGGAHGSYASKGYAGNGYVAPVHGYAPNPGYARSYAGDSDSEYSDYGYARSAIAAPPARAAKPIRNPAQAIANSRAVVMDDSVFMEKPRKYGAKARGAARANMRGL